MAGDWIKMRGVLLNHPKVNRIGTALWKSDAFRRWAMPAIDRGNDTARLSDDALRCVTTALLLRVWSCARMVGKFVDRDLVLDCAKPSDVDAMAGMPGFFDALAEVGWVREFGAQGVVFPDFAQNNSPSENADRQRAYRERRKDKARYDPLQRVTPREEKRREEKREIQNTNPGARDERANPPPIGAEGYPIGQQVNVPANVLHDMVRVYPKPLSKGVLWQRAAKEALHRLVNDHRRGLTLEGAIGWLSGRITLYAKARANADKRFTPDCHNWLDRGQYDDDPAAWAIDAESGGDEDRDGCRPGETTYQAMLRKQAEGKA